MPTPHRPAVAPPHAVARLTGAADTLAAAHQLAAAFAADAARRDRERILPWAELDQFTATGLWGATVPAAHGGAGIDTATLVEVIAALSAADGSLGQIPQNHYYALEVLRVGGTEAQQRFFHDRVLAGEHFGNALAEIGHKDFRRRTRLQPEGGGFRMTGTKYYCTGALFAQWIPTSVVVNEDGREVTRLAFVPRTAAGVSIRDDWDGFGQRVTGSGTVTFDNVRVEAAWVLPFLALFERPTGVGPFAQILHAAIDLGLARGAFAALVDGARAPGAIAPGATDASDPLLLGQVGELAVALASAAALVRRAARLLEPVRHAPDEATVAQASVAVAEARAATTSASLQAGSRLIELGGLPATPGHRVLDRFWRNARTHTLHDPVRWKYHAVGDFHLNQRHPARHSAL